MKKIFLFALAATMLVSCDNFKGSSNSEDETEEEETPKKKKKKKAADEDQEEETDEEETTTKKSRSNSGDDDEAAEDEETSDNGWTSKEKTTFLSLCKDEAMKNVAESRAETYCNCMLEKMEVKYSSYNDANTKMTKSTLNAMATDCNQ